MTAAKLWTTESRNLKQSISVLYKLVCHSPTRKKKEKGTQCSYPVGKLYLLPYRYPITWSGYRSWFISWTKSLSTKKWPHTSPFPSFPFPSSFWVEDEKSWFYLFIYFLYCFRERSLWILHFQKVPCVGT